MMNHKELIYLTYQTFPSEAANTIQTLDNLKYFYRNNYKVKIIFPLRTKKSTDDINILKKYYEFDAEIKFEGRKHNLPFGKIKLGEKYLFIISHYFWSKKICKEIKLNDNKEVQFFTRSDWIFYFLSKNKFNVIFECHQLSKTRKWVLKNSIKNNGSKVIFLNQNLQKDSGINVKEYHNKFQVIPNGVDEDLFSSIDNKKNYEIIFSGNLKRFNESRGLDFVIKAFLNKNMPEELKLKVIGGPLPEVRRLKKYVSKLGLDNKIDFLGRLDRKTTITNVEKASIGLLINSSKNLHSINYSSPLKYFEYLYANLKIIAIDFPSHRALPFFENISYFTENDEESFINAIKTASASNALERVDLKSITMDSRIKKIISLIAK